MSERRPVRAHSLWTDQGGAAAAEFALVLPLLMVLMFGFYEVGRLFWNYSIVSSSARDAARYAARMPLSCDIALTPEETAEIQRLARTGTIAEGATPLIPGWTSNASVAVEIACVENPSDSVTYSGRYEGMDEIPTVSVTVAAPFSPLFTALFPGLTLTSVSTKNAQVWTE